MIPFSCAKEGWLTGPRTACKAVTNESSGLDLNWQPIKKPTQQSWPALPYFRWKLSLCMHSPELRFPPTSLLAESWCRSLTGWNQPKITQTQNTYKPNTGTHVYELNKYHKITINKNKINNIYKIKVY